VEVTSYSRAVYFFHVWALCASGLTISILTEQRAPGSIKQIVNALKSSHISNNRVTKLESFSEGTRKPNEKFELHLDEVGYSSY
jgi:hypothetical protein